MKRINNTTIALVVALAVGALALSFWALEELARPIFGRLAWIFAGMVDFSIIVFILAVLRQNLRNEKARFEWSLVIGATAVSIALNVAHTAVHYSHWEPPTIFYLALASIPPIALALALELLMKQIRSDVTTSQAAQTLADIEQQIKDKQVELKGVITAEADTIEQATADKRRELDNAEQELDKVQAQIDKLNQEIDTAVIEQDMVAARRFKVIQLANTGQTFEDMAETLGVSARTIKRDIESLNGAIAKAAGGVGHG